MSSTRLANQIAHMDCSNLTPEQCATLKRVLFAAEQFYLTAENQECANATQELWANLDWFQTQKVALRKLSQQ